MFFASLRGAEDTITPAGSASDFVSGYLYCRNKRDYRMQIDQCFSETPALTEAISKAMEYQDDNKQSAASNEWNKTPKLIDEAIAECHGEIMASYNYIKGFTASVLERDNARKWIEENYKANRQIIDEKEHNKLSYWKKAFSYESGQEACRTQQLLGFYPRSGSNNTILGKRDPMAAAKFVAGWYYGLSYMMRKDYILTCFIPNSKLTMALYDAMESYMEGDDKATEARGETNT